MTNHLAFLPSLPTLPSPKQEGGPLSSRFVQVVNLQDLEVAVVLTEYISEED